VAKPTHPSLIDTDQIVPDLYNWVNVPTVNWIDEEGRLVRPNDVAFGNDAWKHVTGIGYEKHANALHAGVKGEAPAFSEADVRARQILPSETDQLARAHFGLGWWLHRQGRDEAAARHFEQAGELAPHDFMIRRGSLPIRGISSAGPEFFAMVEDWRAKGNEYYVPLAD
jgi:Tetratricopeptide repeat